MKSDKRVLREKKTVHQMLLIYCHHHHKTRGNELCDECNSLLVYAHKRIDKCMFLPDKPTCKNCVVHCYAPKNKEAIRQVMRFSGPRMMWHSPILAIRHLMDGKKDEERILRFDKDKKHKETTS